MPIAVIVGIIALTVFGIVSLRNSEIRHAKLHAQNAARRARIAYHAHLQRAAYLKAHPEIVARRKAEAALKHRQIAQAAADQAAVVRRANEADAANRAAEQKHQYALDHACEIALSHERSASSESGQAELNDAQAGLDANESCTNDTDKLVNHGYLLSMKAYAEHDLGQDGWQTDFHQANTLLVECQTTPGLYGEKQGAECETQEDHNIRASTQWDMDAAASSE